MGRARYLKYKNRNSHVKSGFTLLETMYGLFFYAIIQLTFMAVIATEINIYERYQEMAYDDFDVFSLHFLKDHTQARLMNHTINTLSVMENNKIGTYRYYTDSNGHAWIRYSLNGGYEPQIPHARKLSVTELSTGNFLFNVRLSDKKDYKILLPLERANK